MTISRKLPPRSTRRGLISAHTSGSTFLSVGLGRLAVSSAVVARPVPREGRSTAFMPPWNCDGPKEEDMLLEVYAPCLSGACWVTGFAAGFVTDVSSQSRQELLSITAFTSCESGPPGSDEGADAKGNEGSAEGPHDGLLLRGLGAFDGDALGHADDVDQARRGEKKAEEPNGHGDVHPEHTLPGILGVGQRP